MNWKVKDEYNEGERLRLACIQDKNKCVSLFQPTEASVPSVPSISLVVPLVGASAVPIAQPKTDITVVLSLLETLDASELLKVIQSAMNEIEKKTKK